MLTRLLTIWDTVRSSLWALPLAMVLVACGAAYVALSIKISVGNDPAWYLYSGGAKETPQFLSNLVSSMITMATLAISITMVVLTLAAQQLGPRLIRSFIADRRTQTSLGLFVSTVVYLLLVLRSAYGQHAAVANLAVTLGTALVLISVATLLFFVHHLARSIIADNVIDRIGAQLDGDIERMLPDASDEHKPQAPKPRRQGATVPLAYGGYVRAIDFDTIVQAATEADAAVELDIRAGQHAVPGVTVCYVVPEKAATDNLCKAIQSAVFVGAERSAVQDLEFSIHQLVEIALRALSPGINDPYTAVAALDRLTLSIRKVMERGLPQSAWHDDDGKLRLAVPAQDFEGIADAAFNQIRQRGANMPAVLIRMAENIGQLLELANDMQQPALQKHLGMVLAAGRRNIVDEHDLKDLEGRVEAAAKQPRSATGSKP
jgi:uncharacterized membrane protein